MSGRNTSVAVRLPCGADPNEVWESAGNPPTAHEMSCVSCAAIRTEALRSRAFAAETDTDDTRARVDVDGLRRFGRSWRAELSPRHVVQSGPQGRLEVRESVLTSIVRTALAGREDESIRSIRFTRPEEPLRVTIVIRVADGVRIPMVAGEMRWDVQRALVGQLGVQPVGVDVIVEDLDV